MRKLIFLKNKPFKIRVLKGFLWFIFLILLAQSLLFIASVIGISIFEVDVRSRGIHFVYGYPPASSIYWTWIYLISASTAGKIALVGVTLVYRLVLPYSLLAQMAKMPFLVVSSGNPFFYSKVMAYHCGFALPFFEWWAIKRDSINILTRLIRGEQIVLPRYPVWYSPSDSVEIRIEKFKVYRLNRAAMRKAFYKKMVSQLRFWRRGPSGNG